MKLQGPPEAGEQEAGEAGFLDLPRRCGHHDCPNDHAPGCRAFPGCGGWWGDHEGPAREGEEDHGSYRGQQRRIGDQPSTYRLTIYRYANIVCFSKYR